MSEEKSWEDKFWSAYHRADDNLNRAWKAENALRDVVHYIEKLEKLAANPERDLNAYRHIFSDHLERALHHAQKIIGEEK